MRISTIPQLYRNFNRWGEILSTLSKYGLADWISRADLGFAKGLLKDRGGEALARQTRETRVRLALTDLGPTFIKLGQILSTRPDLVGAPLADELEQLQASVPSDPPHVVRATIEAELGQSVDELFADYCDEPIASASIGQVHRARLKTGEAVVVKVLHAGIEEKMRVDLEILAGLAQLAERIPEFAPYRPRATVAEVQRMLLRELDFGREERNLQQFANDFQGDGTVRIPTTYPELSTGRVLTMEFLEGVQLADRARLASEGFDLAEVARRGAEIYLEMIFANGFYHADPHPGNLVLMNGNVIGLVDFGMVGRIDEQLREGLEEMLMAITQRDAEQLTAVIVRIGSPPLTLDHALLASDVADFVSHYATQSLSDFDLRGALNEMLELVRRYSIVLPARLSLLIKVLVMLEGTSKLLSPDFSLLELMQPYRSRLLWRRLSPGRRLKKWSRFYSELEHLAQVIPRRLGDMLGQMQAGKFDVHLDHRGLEPSVNRLVLGMLASALFLGSSLLTTHRAPPLVAGISIFGVAGCVVALGLGLRLLRAINKSGHLDRRD